MRRVRRVVIPKKSGVTCAAYVVWSEINTVELAASFYRLKVVFGDSVYGRKKWLTGLATQSFPENTANGSPTSWHQRICRFAEAVDRRQANFWMRDFNVDCNATCGLRLPQLTKKGFATVCCKPFVLEVPVPGLEPGRPLQALDFESNVSANSTTLARLLGRSGKCVKLICRDQSELV